jgi:ubiquinone/menaquinone biosynthesis C-methylase UbiE
MENPMTHSHHTHSTHTSVQTEGGTIHWASYYDAFVKFLTLGQDGALRRKTLERAALKPTDVVLDVGCGTGDLTIAASKQAGQVTGIDAAPEMIEVARKKAARARVSTTFQLEAIERLSFKDGTFDLVLSSLMMHHLPGDLKLRGLKEVYRVLKPGGRILIVEGSRPTGRAPLPLKLLMSHMIHGGGIEELPALLQQAGFIEATRGPLHLGVVGYASACTPGEQA